MFVIIIYHIFEDLSILFLSFLAFLSISLSFACSLWVNRCREIMGILSFEINGCIATVVSTVNCRIVNYVWTG